MLGGLAAGQTYAGSPDGTTGMATWASVKRQSALLLGIQLVDLDALDVPMIATDPYGRFIPGPARGLPQFVTAHGLVEADRAANGGRGTLVPADVRHMDTPFLTDIAHNADPSPQDSDHNPGTPPVAPVPDPNSTPSADFASQPAGTYDDEMLGAHFVCGDGRCNENIALSAIHQVFESEHNRLVVDIKNVLANDTSADGVAALAEWQLPTTADPSGWNGERLFQAARFINEMEYQHTVFEEFARKVQPAIRVFHAYSPDINPAIDAEFAAAVYRFGHSMLDDNVARTNEAPDGTKTDNSLPLLGAFLNPPAYFDSGTPGSPYTPQQAAGAIVMGSSDQIGNELDEFMTETLRNNLLGLPLDLATLNLTRAREVGIPPLNALRRQIFGQTNDGQLAPYTSWADLGQHLKHRESLVNFVAAYGTHPSITSQTSIAGKRAAATLLVDPTNPVDPAIPADAADFVLGTGAWANLPSGVTTTGLDSVDLWVGGLAEATNLNGGLLGSTFNYVFQTQLENLQDGDRLYYLARTPGLNLLSQLEGNSFAEMIGRNTDGTHSLKADSFATADCRFELAHLDGTVTGFGAHGSTVADDPTTGCNETALLQRNPDGTIQYRTTNTVNPTGINFQSVYNGTSAADRVVGGVDSDTIWGGPGKDVIDGGGGPDIVLGGDGADIVTDSDGADILKGGPGNDAIDGGPGGDLLLGGDGQDFINGGSGDNETFAGPGDDFVIAGLGADTVLGDGGNDWMEGGTGTDNLDGDHGAPFLDDPGERAPGADVMIGQPGDNNYSAEGGDDIMSTNAALDRFIGAGGFDWAIHQYDTVPATDDMNINNGQGGLGIVVAANRDRWQEVEGLSGSSFNDVIKGTDVIPRTVGGAGFIGCDVIDQAGVDRISGLSRSPSARVAHHGPGDGGRRLRGGLVPGARERVGRGRHPARRRRQRHVHRPWRRRHHRRRPRAHGAHQRAHEPGRPGHRDRQHRPHGAHLPGREHPHAAAGRVRRGDRPRSARRGAGDHVPRHGAPDRLRGDRTAQLRHRRDVRSAVELQPRVRDRLGEGLADRAARRRTAGQRRDRHAAQRRADPVHRPAGVARGIDVAGRGAGADHRNGDGGRRLGDGSLDAAVDDRRRCRSAASTSSPTRRSVRPPWSPVSRAPRRAGSSADSHRTWRTRSRSAS